QATPPAPQERALGIPRLRPVAGPRPRLARARLRALARGAGRRAPARRPRGRAAGGRGAGGGAALGGRWATLGHGLRTWRAGRGSAARLYALPPDPPHRGATSDPLWPARWPVSPIRRRRTWPG